MDDFHIGDRLTFRGRSFILRGFSPMSAATRRAQLEDVETHEWIELPAEEFRADVTLEARTVRPPAKQQLK